MPRPTQAAPSPERPGQTSWWRLLAVVIAWYLLWSLTPGLTGSGIGSLVTTDPALSVLVETLVALGLVVVIAATHRRDNRVLFAPGRSRWVYVLPLVLAATVPFRYALEAPALLYMLWMTVSVFWQDYLTFGLLQRYLAERLPSWAVIAASAGMFWSGHALLLEHFSPAHPVASLAILALGVVLAALRVRLRTLHVLLALHLSFYFVFVG